MTFLREFLVLSLEEGLTVYGPTDFPAGTPVRRDARRLRTKGPSPASPPSHEMSQADFETWVESLRSDGYEATIEPFWSDPIPTEIGPTQPLHEAFDELLRLAEHRG
jgi:hypothetical protein